MNDSTTTYQGWSNYETWLAYVWLTNDEYGSELLRKAKWEPGEDYEQAQWLSDQYEESLYASLNYDNVFGEASLYRDLIQSAFNSINWAEIVRAD
jgi:hypothetical protein